MARNEVKPESYQVIYTEDNSCWPGGQRVTGHWVENQELVSLSVEHHQHDKRTKWQIDPEYGLSVPIEYVPVLIAWLQKVYEKHKP